jgi:putative ABC transport system permease protein
MASAGYFRTMGATLARGRGFEESDAAGSEPVTVISDAMARRYWPDEEALGKRLRMGAHEPWVRIVGVVRNIKQMDWSADPAPELYFPYRQHANFFNSRPASQMTLVLRTAVEPASLSRALEAEVWALDRNVPVSNVMTLGDIVSGAVRQPRLYAVLLGTFALAAAMLAAVGIYGVISFAVTQRTQEIGVRMAFGARRTDVLGMVMGHGMRLAGLGVGVGLLAGLALAQLLGKLLYGVSAADPLTFVSVSLLLACLAAGACYAPARRATRVDPMVALRWE